MAGFFLKRVIQAYIGIPLGQYILSDSVQSGALTKCDERKKWWKWLTLPLQWPTSCPHSCVFLRNDWLSRPTSQESFLALYFSVGSGCTSSWTMTNSHCPGRWGQVWTTGDKQVMSLYCNSSNRLLSSYENQQLGGMGYTCSARFLHEILWVLL